jgi:hypothetical protein
MVGNGKPRIHGGCFPLAFSTTSPFGPSAYLPSFALLAAAKSVGQVKTSPGQSLIGLTYSPAL